MLILTEKPSVARAFASALGVPRKDGFWENDGYCIVNAVGHLLEDYTPDDYDFNRFHKWSLETLPFLPDPFKYKPIPNTEDQLEIVKNCFDSHRGDEFLLATDAEREGEVIGAEILNYVNFQDWNKAKRFWVSEALTPEVIKKGIAQAKPLADYSPYREQGFARQKGDWYVGMNLTRLLSLKANSDGALHFGRVECAILGAICAREKEVTEFKREKYCELAASLLNNNSPFSVRLVNPDNKEFPLRFSPEAPLLKEVLSKKDSLKSGKITALSKEKKTVHPPKLFNLTGLQKEASRKFSYTPEQTLTIAQTLYDTHKCLSYPRTPSRVMGDENVYLVKGIYEKLKDSYPGPASGADPARISADNKRLFNSAELQDHHALIPLAPVPDTAKDEEKNIFSLVLNSFFTILKAPYIYNAVSVNVDIAGHPFQGAAVEVIDQGWKNETDEDEELPQLCAGLTEGAEYPVASVSQEEKMTEPKKHYTDSSLLSLMENPKNDDGSKLIGIGTPATRGSVIEKLFQRGYLEKQGKSILPSEKGSLFAGIINKNPALATFISIPETTRWEEQLHSDASKFVDGIKAFVIDAVKNTQVDKIARPPREKVSLGPCPLCGGNVYESFKPESKSAAYCEHWRDEKPCKFVIWKESFGAKFTAADAKLFIAGKSTKPKKCLSKTSGKPYEAAFRMEKDGKLKLEFVNREEKKK